MNADTILWLISDLGESSLILALVVATALYFIFCKDYREAFAIVSALVIAGVLIAMLKLGFIGCGHGFLNIRSPSGHSALSLAVYGTLPLLISSRTDKVSHDVLMIFFFALGILIAVTRVALNLHTTNEAILGAAAGMLAVWLVRLLILNRDGEGMAAPHFNIYIFLGLIAFIAVLFHGSHLPTERNFWDIGRKIRHTVPFCKDHPFADRPDFI